MSKRNGDREKRLGRAERALRLLSRMSGWTPEALRRGGCTDSEMLEAADAIEAAQRPAAPNSDKERRTP